MRTKRRAKTTRFRGTHTHGRGFKKKARGSGHQGGVGMAGTGKRGDQKKSLIINLFGNEYFGKDKTLRRGHDVFKPEVINVGIIAANPEKYTKNGKIELLGYKILGDGDVSAKLVISAHSATQSAIDKVKKAGGELTVKFAQVQKAAPAPKEAPKVGAPKTIAAKPAKAPAKK